MLRKRENMGKLLDLLLSPNNRKICRVVGLFLTILPLIFFFAGGFPHGANGQGRIFSSGWFREVFLVLMTLIFIMGLILTLAAFTRKKNKE